MARFVMASFIAVALSLAPVSVSAQLPRSKRMADGKLWTTENLNVTTVPSNCYDNADENCRRYGRLYTWESARQGCQALGNGWRLPTNDEWHQLAKHYGGLLEESATASKAAFTALMIGGTSGFDAVLGGSRTDLDGSYARLDAHGLYWTATETAPDRAWLYNFGKGMPAINRHRNGEKRWALAVRCVRD